MIYIMNGKSFHKYFMKENPKKVLDTNYIVISSRIRYGRKDRPNVMSLSKALMPSDLLLADWRVDSDPDYFKNEYSKQVERSLPLLATIVICAIEQKMTVVFLCSEKEWKMKYLKFIGNAIYNEFGYPVIDYKRFKEGREKFKPFNKECVLGKCYDILEKARRKERKRLMKSPEGRMQLLSEMSKDEMITELRKRGLYVRDMKKKEMHDLMLDFFI